MRRRNAWLSGLAGTLVLELMERFERRVLGRPPLYASTRIAARLAGRLGVSLGPTGARIAGGLLRWSYGPALAVARARLAGPPTRSVARALGFGAAIYAFELVALPALGATPPLRAWPRTEVVSLAAHTLAFALGSELGPRQA
ncbi:MAG TPA: hypothetical protein VHL80_03480 [Polyangia bacterium]|nr:hypothetical protein [Polyangia bacterium]